MPLKERLYSYDVAILKDFGGIKSKLSVHKVLRNSGIEVDDRNFSDKGTVNDEKLNCNISRAKNKVFSYAYCNPWDFFVTLTIDKTKYNRTDLKTYYKNFSQWLRDFSKKHKITVKYLFIPELHEDGESWHMHGFIYGLPSEYLTLFTLSMKIPVIIQNKIRKGDIVYFWKEYQQLFGFITLEKIKSQEKCASYITKYISKNLSDCVKELNNKMYYCSQGLKEAVIIKKGSMLQNIEPDYESDYVKVQWFDRQTSLDTLKSMILSNNEIIAQLE